MHQLAEIVDKEALPVCGEPVNDEHDEAAEIGEALVGESRATKGKTVVVEQQIAENCVDVKCGVVVGHSW